MNTKERNHEPALDRIITRADKQIHDTADQIGEVAARAGEGLEESIESIEMKFNDLRDSVIDKSKEYSKTTERYVSRNPWVSIGISAGFAFLIGMLVGRRR